MKLTLNPVHVLPPVILVFLVFLSNRTGFDLWLSAQFYDASLQAFPWRETPLLSGFMHTGLKNVSVALWFGVFLVLLIARIRPGLLPAAWRSFASSHQGAAVYILCTSLVASLLVAWLKSLSAHSCPWDLSGLGGQFSFFPLGLKPDSAALAMGLGPGQCFPSGHASVGWMWLGVFFLPALSTGLKRSPVGVSLRLLQGTVLVFGLTVSLVQLVRGAHFASHVLATACVCWCVAWLGFYLAQSVRRNVSCSDKRSC